MGRKRNENPRLGLTGVLNTEMWHAMSEKKRREWAVKHANKILPKLVHMDLTKEPSAELTKVYDVTACYTLLDSYYNHRGEVLYVMEWSRAAKAKIIDNEQEV
jgi:ferritin-like protein